MGNVVEKKDYYSFEEYISLEQETGKRYEFYNGELFLVEATTIRHNEIVQNVLIAFRNFFRPKGCKIVIESVKLEVLQNVYYPYPDLMLSCNPNDNDNQLLKYPEVIVEVLSPSTGIHDKSFKWRHYRKMPSLCYYLLISQEKVSIEVFTRIGDSDVWYFQEYTDLNQIILFSTLEFEIKVGEVYDMIVF